MLTRFKLTNYKNFKDTLAIDFTDVGGYQFNPECITNNTIGKMLIYGRNATGKTNLGKAIVDIQNTISAVASFPQFHSFNADSHLDFTLYDYTFLFGNTYVQYSYGKSLSRVFPYESLLINGTKIFHFDYALRSFTHDLKLIGCETLNVNQYLDNYLKEPLSNIQPSFLRWVLTNGSFTNDSIMIQLHNYIRNMSFYSISAINDINLNGNDRFLQSLTDPELNNLENFLNAMGVECKLASVQLPDGQLQLYFVHNRLIPFFQAASSGTLALFNIYRQIVTRMKDLSFFYLDEYDAFFHYEMSERFLKYVKENFPHCQVILTTHNTNLMTNRIMRPDCVFILSQNGTLTALNKATTRELREGHNLEKLYMSGEFDV